MEFPYIGIDGCKAGWFCVLLADDGRWRTALAPDAEALREVTYSAASALIDIPIGFVDAGASGRDCDTEARRCLGRPRASSVFAPPARPTLAARDYRAALAINRRHTGRGISQQAWWIVPKMQAIDALLASNPALHGILRECHPEVCFWALNGRSAMAHNKKKVPGREERRAVLRRYLAKADGLFEHATAEYPRREVALDDIIDALVAAVTAKLGAGRYRSLPADPPHDSRGRPMEMVYWVPTAGEWGRATNP